MAVPSELWGQPAYVDGPLEDTWHTQLCPSSFTVTTDGERDLRV